MDRRQFLHGVAGLSLGATSVSLALGCRDTPQAARPAPSPGRVWRIGVLWPRALDGPPGAPPPEFVAALATRGYRHGETVQLEYRDGPPGAFPTLAADQYQRLADLSARVLNGATPAALPVDQPTHFAFVINRGTARAMGLTIPPALLAQATEVLG